jgi:MinD-like ATPase involved in chromosome partitioning or flagellar assembly
MSVVAIVGGKHSPGATTLALALATAASSADRALLLEADPAGGDIAARAGRTLEPGLLTLAAAGRRGVTDSLVDAHAQRLAGGIAALLAPPSPEQATAAIVGLAPSLVRLVSHRSGICLVDAGRWDLRSPAADFVQIADAIIVAFRPTLEGVEHARVRITSLGAPGPRIVATAVGERPYPPDEVASALGDVELHVIPSDPRSAAALASGASMDRWLARGPLMRSAAALLERLDDRDRSLSLR